MTQLQSESDVFLHFGSVCKTIISITLVISHLTSLTNAKAATTTTAAAVAAAAPPPSSSSLSLPPGTNNFHITILHTNDFHSKFQQISKYSSQCKTADINKDRCYGGIARISSKIKEIRAKQKNVLVLDAGDQFQGSFWFEEFKGYASSYFMNVLQYDVMCLGNHEFDEGLSGLEPFLTNVTFPVVCANVNNTGVKELQKVVKSVTLNVSGHSVGIVGYITVNTAFLATPGTVSFTDEVESVKAEVAKLEKAGVTRIIALGHAGFIVDQRIAREVSGVDLVIGGHTNTFLYNGAPPSIEMPEGSYPTIITQTDGTNVPVVQSYAYGKYLGHLNVEFDSKGHVTSWNGNPILLDHTVKQDNDILSKMKPFLKVIKKAGSKVLGKSNVLLTGPSECREKECNLGNLVTDAMVFFSAQFAQKDSWSKSAIAVLNGGSIRSSVEAGNITYLQIIETLPFANSVDIIEITGETLMAVLEQAVVDFRPGRGKFLQMSGIRVTYDLSRPNGQRVISVSVRCSKCPIPIFKDIDLNHVYRVMLSDYLINGGDGYSMIKENMKRHIITGLDQKNLLMNYIKYHSPLINGIEGRISMIGKVMTTVTIPTTTNQSSRHHLSIFVFVFIILTVLQQSIN
ncbi:5'-nucleotidase-like [Argonauta hians]